MHLIEFTYVDVSKPLSSVWSVLISKTPYRHPAFFPRWQNSTQNKATMVNRRLPHSPMNAARDAAQSISSADSADSFCGGAAVVGGSGAE